MSNVSSSSGGDTTEESSTEESGDDSTVLSVQDSSTQGNSGELNTSSDLDVTLSSLQVSGKSLENQQEQLSPPKVLKPPPEPKPKSERSRVYVLSTSMFKEYPIIRAYATGPKDPTRNPHKWYCRICHKNYSLKTRGGSSIARHHRSRRHFRRDQRYRDAQSLPVYNRAGVIVTGDALDLERDEFSKVQNVPNLGSKRLLIGQSSIPLAGDDVGVNTILTSQMLLYHDFIVNSVPLPVLPSVWGKFGVATAHSSLVSNYCWDHPHVFVSFCFLFLLFLFLHQLAPRLMV